MSDISELFAKDPLSLTKEDRTEIITYYRENRLKFLAGLKQEKLPKVKAEKAPKGPVPDIDLDDLEL